MRPRGIAQQPQRGRGEAIRIVGQQQVLTIVEADALGGKPHRHHRAAMGKGLENLDARATAGPAPIASEALERIAALYAADADIRGRSTRQEKSRPLLIEALEHWLRGKLELISQK